MKLGILGTLSICALLVGQVTFADTVKIGFDGKWEYENLFSPESDLGIVSIEISDGKSMALRNIDVITANIINIRTRV